MLQAVEESVRHNDNDLYYLNGFEDFGWMLWSLMDEAKQ
jgi:hypothetical protein